MFFMKAAKLYSYVGPILVWHFCSCQTPPFGEWDEFPTQRWILYATVTEILVSYYQLWSGVLFYRSSSLLMETG